MDDRLIQLEEYRERIKKEAIIMFVAGMLAGVISILCGFLFKIIPLYYLGFGCIFLGLASTKVYNSRMDNYDKLIRDYFIEKSRK